MKILDFRGKKQFTLSDAIQARISAYLYEVYASDNGLLGDLDRWTQRRITDENMAKYQGSIDVHTSGMTRRTFLLIMFILKEGNLVRHSCTHARALGVARAFSSMLRVMSFARFVMLVPHVCF